MGEWVKPEHDKQGNGFLRNSSRITEEENLPSLSFLFTGEEKLSLNHSHILPSYVREKNTFHLLFSNFSSVSSSFSGLKNDSPLLFLPLYHRSSSFAEEENHPSLSSSDLNQENTSNLSSSKCADNFP